MNISGSVKTEKNTSDSSTFSGTCYHFISSIYRVSDY